MLGWNVKYIILIISFVSLCNAQLVDKKEKHASVQDVIQKIYNLTSEALRNATANDKDEILRLIKNKLLKSSYSLGIKANKYVDLIMKGIQIMASYNQSTTPSYNEASVTVPILRNSNTKEPNESTTNNDLVKKMASKIFSLAQKQFRKAKTDEEKQKVLENIRKRVMETAKQKHDLIHTKHNEIKSYTDLISRGMELMMDTIHQKKRRMIMEFLTNKISSDRDEESVEEEYNQLEQRTNFNENGALEIGKVDMTNERSTKMPMFNPTLTTPFSCEGVFWQTCSEIKSINEFVCLKTDTRLPLKKLCNGIMDCSDGSDERNCVIEATKRLHHATDIMSRIEIYLLRKCFLTEDNTLILKQNGVLYDVLKKQIGFINKYKDMNLKANDFGDVYAFKQTLNEVAVVINTLSVALDSSLCNRFINQRNAETMARKYIPTIVENLDEFPTQPQISLKSCTCSGSFCVNSTCPEVCKRVCWHKYNLGKWSCQAVDETTTISLDMVCDDKLDCYDESDESDCNSGVGTAKFEANDIFQNIVKTVEAKIVSKDYVPFLSKLHILQSSIKKLQMEVVKSDINMMDIKNARDECFASLSSVYENILEKSPRGFDLEKAHYFLLTVNEQLMIALKNSHTGNAKIISSDGCYCRDGKCALNKCSKSCTRSCSVEPQLTKYICKGSDYNVSVPINKVCNGKVDCQFEDDEADCSDEVCRKHHLILLQHSIRDVGESDKGTSVGEALRSWKSKVISTLKIAEDNYRPTHATLQDIVNDVLHDLVQTYISLDENLTRRNKGYALKEFLKLSQLVIGAVKSCGK